MYVSIQTCILIAIIKDIYTLKNAQIYGGDYTPSRPVCPGEEMLVLLYEQLTSQVGVTAPSHLGPSLFSPILWWASGRHPSSLKNLHTCINLNNKELKQERSPRWWHFIV